MKQSITYITIRIHKHNNNNTQFPRLNGSIQNIQQKCTQQTNVPSNLESAGRAPSLRVIPWHLPTMFYIHIYRSKHVAVVGVLILVIKNNQLMLYREIIAVCSQIHIKHINTVFGQNLEFVYFNMVVHIVTTLTTDSVRTAQ
jgi:hypothetical protein